MNVQRQLAISDSGLTKALERLSSGYRINSASDDSAGLAISQTFRADIASFKVASRNATEANSLLQVAEGAMDQIGNMLVRLKELATQAASANAGTSRAQIDAEKTKIIAEMERIASVTEYAGSALIDGTFGSISGTLGGGAATSTNSYAVNSDMSQKFKFADATNTLWTPTASAAAGNNTLSYQLVTDTSNFYGFVGSGLDTAVVISGGAADVLSEGSYRVDVGGGGTTLFLMSGTTTVSVGTYAANVVTFSNGIVLTGAGAITTGAFDNSSITFTDTAISSWSMDGSQTTAVAASTAFTVSSSSDTSIVLTSGGNTFTSSAISDNKAYFAELGLTINLDADYTDNEDDDLVGMVFTTEAGAGSATSTSTITIASSKTGLTAGTYSIDKVSSATVSIGNGSFTEYAAVGSSKTVTFTELGVTMVGASNLSANILGNDSFVIADTGITATSVTDSTTTGTYTIADSGGSITVTHSGGSYQTETGAAGNVIDFDQLGIKVTLGSDYTAGALNSLSMAVAQGTSKTFQLGTANNADHQMAITLTNVTTGSSGLNISAMDLGTSAGALSALTSIDTAITTHSTARGNIGSYMNRLGYASANLATTVQNIQAAESAIRDADMAEEMTAFTKNQILMQAGTAMLTQANMAPQMVLSLFG